MYVMNCHILNDLVVNIALDSKSVSKAGDKDEKRDHFPLIVFSNQFEVLCS